MNNFNLNISTMIISRSFVQSRRFSFSFQVNYYFNFYSLLSGVCIILALVATPTAQLAGSHSRRRLHDQLVKSVMCNSLHFFQSTPFGRIINRFSMDTSIIDKVSETDETITKKGMKSVIDKVRFNLASLFITQTK